MEQEIQNVQNSASEALVETPKKSENQNQISAAIVVAGLIIAGAIFLNGKGAPTPSPTPSGATAPSITKLNKPVSSEDHILGDMNAKVVIVEYSDLECPFCKIFHATMHRLVTDYKGDVAWVYRHYPIPQLHQKATHEAEASECAWEQGGNTAFWAYVDEIFKVTKSNDGLPETSLPKIAGSIGLDVAKFNSCLSGGTFAQKVADQVSDGGAMGVRGTPSSFIVVKGKVVDTIPGASPYEKVKSQIDAALK